MIYKLCRAGYPLLFACVALLLAAACGGDGNKLDEAMKSVTDDQLAIMVLPKEELGEDAADLPVDPSSGAGFIDNDQAAQESPDPEDTAGSLGEAGRLNGYELSYADYSRSEGALEVDSAVELYTGDDAASAAMSKLVDDFKRFEGQESPEGGYYFEDVETSDVQEIGDEAVYLTARFVVTDPSAPPGSGGHTSAVIFRLGRLLAYVSQVRADDKGIKSTLEDGARTMVRRIEEILPGQLAASPVPIPSEEEAAAIQIQGVLDQIAQAFNGKDVDGYLGFWTDKGLQEAFGVSRQEALEFLQESIGEPPIDFRNVSNAQFSDNGATVEADFIDGVALKRARISLVDQGNGPQIDGIEYLLTQIPPDATPVPLKLTEFAFQFDPQAITGGNIAFEVENIGKQPHEIIVERVPPDLDVLQALQSETEPEGVESVAFFGPVKPGEKTSVVFTEALPPGRYALLCFFPDADDPAGTPHALKGMIGEFTVE